ncbi:hypothetical protein HYG82_20835 [Natrinema halophilum]|nr:hypothetical protein HYG82_20835 [Natrinema halophilum]
MSAPADVGFVLHDHIDPGALDTILSRGSGLGEVVVSFDVASENRYAIEISDDGRLTIRDERGD